MQMSEEGRRVLTRLEGKRNKMYKDVVGLPTVGVGHLLTRSELTSGKLYIHGEVIRWGDGLTDSQVDGLLAQDLKGFEDTVSLACPSVSQHEFDALTSFTFNVGKTAFLNSQLLKAIRAGRLADVPAQLRRWNRAGGRVIGGLVARREAEILMWSGEYI